jgi:hypothetical protein
LNEIEVIQEALGIFGIGMMWLIFIGLVLIGIIISLPDEWIRKLRKFLKYGYS